MTVLKAWLSNPDTTTFPYAWVVDQIQFTGKHFLAQQLRDDLTSALALRTAKSANRGQLISFILNTLDKHEDRFCYASYLGLNVFDLPSLDHPVEQSDFAQPKCDRITLGITADLIKFELSAHAGSSPKFLLRPPDRALAGKRLHLALRAMTPALGRSAIYQVHDLKLSARGADRVRWAVESEISLQERRSIELTMLPVYVEHDEYLFIRILQACETFFALIGSQLRGALSAYGRGEIEHGNHFLGQCERAFCESMAYFSLVATMRPEAFANFRQYTEGASAIQSENYKLIESLCREPDHDRLASAAYSQVPRIRRRIIAGQHTIGSAVAQLLAEDSYGPRERQKVLVAVTGLGRSFARWRQTHFRLATRLLGAAPGTGYTEGVPYLARSKAIPVIPALGLPENSTDQMAVQVGKR